MPTIFLTHIPDMLKNTIASARSPICSSSAVRLKNRSKNRSKSHSKSRSGLWLSTGRRPARPNSSRCMIWSRSCGSRLIFAHRYRRRQRPRNSSNPRDAGLHRFGRRDGYRLYDQLRAPRRSGHVRLPHRPSPEVRMGRQLMGATLGIIGYGAIGEHLAELGVALGMTVLVADPHKRVTRQCSSRSSLGICWQDRIRRVPRHCQRAHRKFDERRSLRAMMPSAYFINCRAATSLTRPRLPTRSTTSDRQPNLMWTSSYPSHRIALAGPPCDRYLRPAV